MAPSNNSGNLTLTTYVGNPLSFADLRQANRRRLPLFKNRRGEVAHSKADVGCEVKL